MKALIAGLKVTEIKTSTAIQSLRVPLEVLTTSVMEHVVFSLF